MTDIILDIEADDLLPMTSRIWVCVVKILGKEDFRVCHEPAQLTKIIPHVGKVIMHNGLGFDLWALMRLWDIPFRVKPDGKDEWMGHEVQFVDTLHLSQYLNPDRLNGHSLEAWGHKVKMLKLDHKDFSEYTPEMLTYCKQDCRITDVVYHQLMQEMSRG